MDVDDIDVVMAVSAVLLLTAIGASRLSSRLGVPALVLFLGIGILAGSEGIGGLDFEDYELAQGVGIVALPSSCLPVDTTHSGAASDHRCRGQSRWRR